MWRRIVIWANVVLAAAFLALSIMVDGNGCILGLNETFSMIASAVVVGGAMLAAGILIAQHGLARRICGVILEVVYIVSVFPLFTPW
jgi:hypothetical protein